MENKLAEVVPPISPTSLTHRTVLLDEAVQALVVDPQGVYVDATFGRGGHSRKILGALGAQGRLLAIDRDLQAVAHAAEGDQAISDKRFSIHHAPFSQWDRVLDEAGVRQVDGVLLDIGVSSPQIDDPARGFSFRFDAPLDMRMDTSRGMTAAEYIEQASVQELTEVIREYGEERFAGPVAKAIVARRTGGEPIRTTGDLSEVVARAVKTREPGQNPATRTFQALRMVVNAELEELKQALAHSLSRLKPGGRLVVISFHSLEDREVKTFIARESRSEVDRRAPFAPPAALRLRSIARIKPSEAEVSANPRSRSAVMRVAERTEEGWV